ncbi:glycosyltransferase 87 family protein [Streptomyces sp. NPDC002920]
MPPRTPLLTRPPTAVDPAHGVRTVPPTGPAGRRPVRRYAATFRRPGLYCATFRRPGLYWVACAVFALLLALTTSLTPHRIWGACAAVGYTAAAVLAHRARRAASPGALTAALAGAVAVPLAVLIVSGSAQSEVHVVQHSGSLLLHTGSPYLSHPAGVDDYNPYLPGMALFGLPHALLGATPSADARLWFGAVFLGALLYSARRADGAPGRPGRHSASALDPTSGPGSVVPLLAAFPAVALPLAVGGVDLPVIGLMCLGLALAGRRGSGVAAGLAMGGAAALKWTAWPLLPVGLALLAVTAGRRAAVRATGTALLVAGVVVVPAASADPHAFVEQVVLFPLGRGGAPSPAASPLPGQLLAAHVPGGSTLALCALTAAALAMGVWLAVRPPRTVVAAADRLAVGLGLAMCLIPATRFGYLAYPLVLAAWFRCPLIRTARFPHPRPTPAPGAAAPGATVTGAVAPGGPVQGGPVLQSAMSGVAAPGAVVPGGPVQGSPVQGGPVSQSAMSGVAAPGAIVSGVAAPEGAEPGGPVPQGVIPAGAAPGGPVPGAAAPEAAVGTPRAEVACRG